MNRRNSKKSTPKKKPKQSSTASRKTSTATPNKSPKVTPMKSRLRSRTSLPVSPISISMKQPKITDIFKRSSREQLLSSPSILTNQREVCSETPPPNEVSTTLNGVNSVQRKATKGPKDLQPIFGPQKRHSSKKSNSAKRLKLETNEKEHNCPKQLFTEITDNNKKSVSEEMTKVAKIINQKKVFDKSDNDNDLGQMMSALKLKSPWKSTDDSGHLTTVDNNRSPLISDSNSNELCKQVVNDFEEDIDLTPVFKIPEVPKPKKSTKENAKKYVDKEKEKKMSYFLKNLSRVQKDKQMINIQSIEEIQKDFLKVEFEETVVKSEFCIKSFEGIDIFSEYIPKAIANYLSEENKCSSEESNIFSEIPLNRLLPFIQFRNRTLKESECQQLISRIILCVSTEDNQMICTQSEHKIFEFLSENDFEMYLSLILKDFYRILSIISANARDVSVSDPNHCLWKKDIKSLANVIRVLSQILTKGSFKIEAINSVEERIKLLTICFGLGLDHRIMKNGDLIIDIKNFIEIILNTIFVDEHKAITIVESLISFCTLEEKTDVMIALEIASLFPLNIDFDLKRKFCVSVIQLFIPNNINEFVMNLNEIPNILTEIEWKSLSPEDIYVIIKMIGLSLDLPKDLIDYKQTISSILGVIDNKINSCVPKTSEFEFSEITKLLMILRTKVNVSTKKI